MTIPKFDYQVREYLQRTLHSAMMWLSACNRCYDSTLALLHQFAPVNASIGSHELPHTFRFRGINSHQPAQRIWASPKPPNLTGEPSPLPALAYYLSKAVFIYDVHIASECKTF